MPSAPPEPASTDIPAVAETDLSARDVVAAINSLLAEGVPWGDIRLRMVHKRLNFRGSIKTVRKHLIRYAETNSLPYNHQDASRLYAGQDADRGEQPREGGDDAPVASEASSTNTQRPEKTGDSRPTDTSSAAEREGGTTAASLILLRADAEIARVREDARSTIEAFQQRFEQLLGDAKQMHQHHLEMKEESIDLRVMAKVASAEQAARADERKSSRTRTIVVGLLLLLLGMSLGGYAGMIFVIHNPSMTRPTADVPAIQQRSAETTGVTATAARPTMPVTVDVHRESPPLSSTASIIP